MSRSAFPFLALVLALLASASPPAIARGVAIDTLPGRPWDIESLRKHEFFFRSACWSCCAKPLEFGPHCARFKGLGYGSSHTPEESAACLAEQDAATKKLEAACTETCPNLWREAGAAEVAKQAALLVKAEKDFKSNYGTYTTDLGFLLTTQERYSYAYKLGFVKAGSGKLGAYPAKELLPERLNSDYFLARDEAWLPINAGARKLPFSSMAAYCHDCSATEQGFKALFFAPIPQTQKLDVWTVDQDEKLLHVQDGFLPLRESQEVPAGAVSATGGLKPQSEQTKATVHSASFSFALEPDQLSYAATLDYKLEVAGPAAVFVLPLAPGLLDRDFLSAASAFCANLKATINGKAAKARLEQDACVLPALQKTSDLHLAFLSALGGSTAIQQLKFSLFPGSWPESAQEIRLKFSPGALAGKLTTSGPEQVPFLRLLGDPNTVEERRWKTAENPGALELALRLPGTVAQVAASQACPIFTPPALAATPAPPKVAAEPPAPIKEITPGACQHPFTKTSPSSAALSAREQPLEHVHAPSDPAEPLCLGACPSSYYVNSHTADLDAAAFEYHLLNADAPLAGGEISVTVAKTNKPLVLTLICYQPVRWKLKLEPGARVDKIYLGGHDKGLSTVVDFPAEKIQRIGYDIILSKWEQDGTPLDDFANNWRASLAGMVRLPETSFQAFHQPESFHVPFYSSFEKMVARERGFLAEHVSQKMEVPAGQMILPQVVSPFQMLPNYQSKPATFTFAPYDLRGRHFGPAMKLAKPVEVNITSYTQDEKTGEIFIPTYDGIFIAGAAKEIKPPATLPPFRYVAALAFDTKRRRVVGLGNGDAGNGGKGYAFAYYPDTQKWELLGEAKDPLLSALAYDKTQDRFLGVANFRDEHINEVQIFSPDLVKTGNFHLPQPIIAPRNVHKLELVDGQLVLAVFGGYGLNPVNTRTFLVIDPVCGETMSLQ